MSRSRDGLNTRFHALVNENGLPLRFHLTPGQAHDAPAACSLLSNLQPDQQVLADKAYDADWIRALICEQGAQAVIPSKSNRKMPQFFDRTAYRCPIPDDHIAPRYEKMASNFMALIKIASVRL